MLESIIAGAIASSSEAHDAWLEAAAAEEEMVRARRAGNFPSEPLEERAAVLARARPSVCLSLICGARRPRAWRERSASPGAVRPGGRVTCAGRPKRCSALRPA